MLELNKEVTSYIEHSAKIGNKKSKQVTDGQPMTSKRRTEPETSRETRNRPQYSQTYSRDNLKNTRKVLHGSTFTQRKKTSSLTVRTGSESEGDDFSARLEMRRVSFEDFNGLLAPVFTMFKDDKRRQLDVRNILRYAQWVKSENIKGVLVNGVTGEGPALGLKERKAHCEHWTRAATAEGLLLMVQIGGAPLPDVLDLALHAESLGVNSVCLLPELFYKPRNVDQLVGYCSIVAKRCSSRPFFYYHTPTFTGVDLDMVEFCAKAEESIPNFYGIIYSSFDLDMGYRCLREGRIIMLNVSTLLASGLMCGFTSLMLTTANLRPDLVKAIIEAFDNNNLHVARTKQEELNRLIEIHTHSTHLENYVVSMKMWFNKEMIKKHSFSAGPARKLW